MQRQTLEKVEVDAYLVDSRPLVLWLNGGPGCSSVGAGAFVEHGPFRPRGNVLLKNEYSWNKEANMLYLESPAGVGFSFSSNKSFYDYVNDEMTARDSLVFLQHWFDKFPQYKDRDFLISGESYGGHYVPQLAQLIVKSKAKINLKGIAIGNPLLEFNTDFNSRGEYFWSHGLISDATYDLYNTVCNYSQIRRQAQKGALTPGCSRVITQTSNEIGRLIDSYDVTLDVCLSSDLSQSKILDKTHDSEKVDVCVEEETVVYLRRAYVNGCLLFVLLSGISVCILKKKKLKREERLKFSSERIALTKIESEELELPLIGFDIIEKATNMFSDNNKLGEGGFGPVYKGILDNGQEIAVKRLSKNSGQGLEEFKNEVSCIAKLQHRNLVALLGCCVEHGERILIYEYMPHKSLDFFIFDEETAKSMDWAKRYNIINGIARGLLYFHQDSKLRLYIEILKPAIYYLIRR